MTMATEEKTLAVQELVKNLLADEPAFFLVRVHIRPISNISVYIDGDAGVTIEKCVRLNRALYKEIVETGIYVDGNFALEVSSPGIDEPLVMHRQYIKNIGRMVEIETNEGAKFDGKLIAVGDNDIEVEEEKGKGKKKETIRHFLQFDQLKSTTVKIVF